jgi:hypothetical protein
MAGQNPPPGEQRWTSGLVAVAVGVGALLIAFVIVATKWKDTTGIAALGVIASPIAAIVGAYFGIQVSATAAKDATTSAEKAQERVQSAETERARALSDVATVMGRLSPSDAEAVRPGLLSVQ